MDLSGTETIGVNERNQAMTEIIGIHLGNEKIHFAENHSHKVFLSQSRHLGILLVQSEYYLIKYCMLDDRARHCEITFVKNIENVSGHAQASPTISAYRYPPITIGKSCFLTLFFLIFLDFCRFHVLIKNT